MRLKSFQAATMAEAMRQVRQVLGDDAIIVATREEPGGGVRLTAAIDDSDPVSVSPPEAGQYRGRGPAPPHRPPVDIIDLVADALIRHGTPASVSERLLETIENYDSADPLVALGAALDAVYRFEPLPEGRAPRPIMLIGPPGAGKTLTVAKLATRAVLAGRRPGVITTDTARAGGVHQLQAFTRLLKIRLLAVEDPAALADALTVHHGAEQIIIDSAGRNPFDPEDMADLGAFIAAADIEPVLVLPSGADAVESAETASAFHILGAKRLLLTRLDLSRRLGSVLATAYQANMTFCDIGNTYKVVDGLAPLNPISLARLMMPATESKPRTARTTGKQTGTRP